MAFREPKGQARDAGHLGYSSKLRIEKGKSAFTQGSQIRTLSKNAITSATHFLYHQRLLIVQPELTRRHEVEQRKNHQALHSNSAGPVHAKCGTSVPAESLPNSRAVRRERRRVDVTRSLRGSEADPSLAGFESESGFQNNGEIRAGAGCGELSCSHCAKAGGGAGFRVSVPVGSGVLPGRD